MSTAEPTLLIIGLARAYGSDKSLLLRAVADPWWSPQHAIPILGMLLGNTMTGVALSIDRLTSAAWSQRKVLEARLMLGED
ncbi:MAG: ABC transporter permease [Verrucomicrobiales bacterium]